jgi:hypothetical protein
MPEKNTSNARMWCERLLKRKLPKMLKEELVDGKIPFNSDAWKDEWFSDMSPDEIKSIVVRNTRCITGIDPYKFKQYNVMFYKSQKSEVADVLDCDTALEDSHFKSVRPYYIVRAYQFDTNQK